MNLTHQPKDRVARWIKKKKENKQESTVCYLQEKHSNFKDTYRLKVNGWKKRFHASRNQKEVRITIPI